MRYTALGDSISISLYTGIEGGGAAETLARLLPAEEFDDRTYDGATTSGVLARLAQRPMISSDLVTLTIGGNDLLGGAYFRRAGDREGVMTAFHTFATELGEILDRVAPVAQKLILNTIYDPTDGRDEVAAEMGLDASARVMFGLYNEAIRTAAAEHGALLADLERLFLGHGYWSDDPWIVQHIEPNARGAEEIARLWHSIAATKD